MRDLGISVLAQGVTMQRLLLGLLITARIAFVSAAFSMAAGIFTGILMTRQNPALRFFCRLYLEAMRIIPVLVWLFIFYFGISRNLRINLTGEAAAILVFTLWGAAEMGDIVRGAVTSLSKHQYESAQALGLSEAQLYVYIIIPQAVRRMAPGAINLVTRMIKTTSLVVLIGVVEVLKTGQQVIETNFLKNPAASFWVYGFIFFLYFILCMPISHVSKLLEKRWQS